jgi:hypothetical protein
MMVRIKHRQAVEESGKAHEGKSDGKIDYNYDETQMDLASNPRKLRGSQAKRGTAIRCHSAECPPTSLHKNQKPSRLRTCVLAGCTTAKSRRPVPCYRPSNGDSSALVSSVAGGLSPRLRV